MSAERDSLAAFEGGVNAGQLDEFWAEYSAGPEIDETPTQVLDQHLFSALREHDPSARLSRRLDLRLAGLKAGSGRIDIGIAHEIFRAFAQEVSGAAEFNSLKGGVSLELTGVSKGSAVLHLAPAQDEDFDDREGQLQVDLDPVDEVFSTITELHRTAEDRGDLHPYAEHEGLVRGLRNLAETLDEHDLDLEVGWRSATGIHRNSRLNRSARRYLQSLWKIDSYEQTRYLSGYVVRLDLGGTFAVKESTARNSRRYEVQVDGRYSDDSLVNLHLELGQLVHVRVVEKQRINHLGIKQASSYHYVRLEGSQLSL